MRTRPASLLLPTFRLLLVCLSLCSGGPLRADEYTDRITEARDHLQNDRFLEALTSANDAVRLNPSDYRSPYQVAMAYLGLNRFDDADNAAAKALVLAPDVIRPSIEKLVRTIKARRISLTSLQEAEAALADGLNGKAARLYEQSWNAERIDAVVALKAADLYVTRLNQPVDAARVLRQIQNALRGTPDAKKAEAELQQLAETLQKIALAKVAAAKEAPCDKALGYLQLAEDADPGLAQIYRQRMTCITTVDELKGNLKGMARLNLATPDNLFALKRMGVWMKQADVRQFMTDLIGKTQADELEQRLIERQVQYDAAVAKYKADVEAYEKKAKDDQETYARKLIEKDVCLTTCKKKHGGLFGNAQTLQLCEKGCVDQAESFVPKEAPKPVAPVELE